LPFCRQTEKVKFMKKRISYSALVLSVMTLIGVSSSAQGVANVADETATQPGVISSEFVFDRAPFPSSHASTIAQTTKGDLIAAWFGGTREKHKDVGIWIARRENRGGWTPVVEVANGVQENGERYPCWNPVLFQPRRGPMLLFYKVGPSPSTWWGMMTTSADGGKTWSKQRKLPQGILGPIKNKPIELDDGTLLCPSSTEDAGWRVHLESTSDQGQTWKQTAALNDPKQFAAIQPTIIQYESGRIQLLCRSEQGVITESWSEDGAKTWGAMRPTTLPNPNSGIDAVKLKDGRALLIYNHTKKGRSPLNAAITADGKQWKSALVLETQPGEYSYPAVIQTSDGLVHITYTWNRKRVKHVVVDPQKLKLGEMTEPK
jgi:predicted neuraminidase